MKTKLKFFTILGAVLFSVSTLYSIDFTNITAVSITGFGNANIPTVEGEVLATAEEDARLCSLWGDCGGPDSYEGKTVVSDQNEGKYGFSFGGSAGFEIDNLFTIVTGVEYEQTAVHYQEGQEPMFSAYGTDIWGIPRELTHRTLSIPVHLAYKISFFDDMMRFYLNGGPNIVYYIGGEEEYFFREAVVLPKDKPNEIRALTAGGTLLGLPLDIALELGAKIGFPIPPLGGEFLLGAGYTMYFNSPKYTTDSTIATNYFGDTHNRDYSLMFSPFKFGAGFKFYLSGGEQKKSGATSSSSRRTSRTRSSANTISRGYNW